MADSLVGPSIRLEEFTITDMGEDFEGKVWIEQDGGEGGSFDVHLLVEVVRKFYDDNF